MSERVMEILRSHTPLVEQLSIDEAFLDLSDLPQPALELAQMLQREIHVNLNLPCSIGAASSKLLAKTATDMGKARHRGDSPPNAIEVVPPGEEAAYLAVLSVQALWGVGPKTAARLADLGIKTIGELARIPEEALARQFGQAGRDMHRRANGIDDRPVTVERFARSISAETTFDQDLSDAALLQQTLRSLSESVARDLREKGLCASTVRLKIRWPDFETHTRQVMLPQPADSDGVIFEAALNLLHSIWQPGKPVRLVGVGTTRLTERAHQLALWDTPNQKERRLLDALDNLRDRFGDTVVWKGKKK
jgi:DNA polymerase-4